MEAHERRRNESQGGNETTEPSALESAESYVATSPGTGHPGDASGEAFPVAFRALMEWGETNGLINLNIIQP